MSASEIISELPKLSEAERLAVFERLCELSEGDQRWNEIIDDPRPLPKLEVFFREAAAEGGEQSLDSERL